MTKKVRKFANGGALSDIISVDGGPEGKPSVDPGYNFPPSSSGSFGGGGGSATEGLGQVNQGSQTISTALQRAQQANSTAANAAQQANAAVGGGGGGALGGLGAIPDYAKQYTASIGGFGTAPKQIDTDMPKYTGTTAPTNYQSSAGLKKGGTVKKYAKGGRISLEHCGVSTHTPSKKNANW